MMIRQRRFRLGQRVKLHDLSLDGSNAYPLPPGWHDSEEVTVIGVVQNTTSHFYREYLARDDYIGLSGGTTRKADRGRNYIVRADGSEVSSESGGGFRSGKKHLIDTGMAVEEGGRVRIAQPSGKSRAPAGDALISLWSDRLPPAGATVLRDMWAAKPLASARVESLAAKLGYATTGGGWRSGIKALRDAGIATVSGGRITFTSEFIDIAGAAS